MTGFNERPRGPARGPRGDRLVDRNEFIQPMNQQVSDEFRRLELEQTGIKSSVDNIELPTGGGGSGAIDGVPTPGIDGTFDGSNPEPGWPRYFPRLPDLPVSGANVRLVVDSNNEYGLGDDHVFSCAANGGSVFNVGAYPPNFPAGTTFNFPTLSDTTNNLVGPDCYVDNLHVVNGSVWFRNSHNSRVWYWDSLAWVKWDDAPALGTNRHAIAGGWVLTTNTDVGTTDWQVHEIETNTTTNFPALANGVVVSGAGHRAAAGGGQFWYCNTDYLLRKGLGTPSSAGVAIATPAPAISAWAVDSGGNLCGISVNSGVGAFVKLSPAGASSTVTGTTFAATGLTVENYGVLLDDDRLVFCGDVGGYGYAAMATKDAGVKFLYIAPEPDSRIIGLNTVDGSPNKIVFSVNDTLSGSPSFTLYAHMLEVTP